MYPVLFHLGGQPIRTYTVLIDLGLLAGLALAYWLWHRRRQAPAIFLDAVVCALFGAMVGGRALYVATNWPYFATHRAEIGRASCRERV